MRGLVGRVALTIMAAFMLGISCTTTEPESGSFCSSSNPYSETPDSTSLEVEPPPFFVAFGNGIATSADGILWTRRESAFGNFSSAAYGDGQMIAYGGDFGGCIGLSENGAVWTELVSESLGGQSFALAYGAGRFVAMGANSDPLAGGGSAFASDDGVTWTSTSGDIPEARSVIYGDGTFVAVGNASIATSPDGLSWTSAAFDAPRQLFDVAHGDEGFVVTGNSGSIFTGSDGLQWSAQQSGLTDGYFLRGVTHGDGLFVAVGDRYAPSSRMNTSIIITSPDGVAWAPRHSAAGQELLDIAYGNGRFVVVGENLTTDAQGNTTDTAAIALSSSDGINWTTTAVDDAAFRFSTIAFWPTPAVSSP